jgi:hypothetical protein
MTKHRLWFCLAVLGLAAALPPIRAESPPDKKPPLSSTEEREAAELAARIDALINAGYQAKKVTPAPPADDAEFLRRVYLDLAGRIPRFDEVRDFLDDKSPDKRRQVVERLLGNAGYVRNFTAMWRILLVPPANNREAQFLGPQLDPWLRKRIRDNVPYDQMVRDLLTSPVAFNRNPQGNGVDGAPMAFYQVNEGKPENLAAATSRVFLGVKLECAQCHDHPFGKWSRKQFWELAAFFGGVRSLQPQAGAFAQLGDAPEKHEVTIPGTEKIVQARFLDGKEPTWKENASARQTLAEWMTMADNPFLARAAVNRLWGHFFGIGLVDPVDDFNDDNQPSHPELLDELAREFVKHKYDQKFIIRAITASKTYQLTSAQTDSSQQDPRTFARLSLKGLTAEQLFDSLALATGYDDTRLRRQPNFNPNTLPRTEFLAKFANYSDKRTEFTTSILQALALMNGKVVADMTSTDLEKSVALAAVLDAPFMDTRQRLDSLFMSSLSRKMRPDEADRLVKFVNEGGPSKNPNKALADVFWALLNGSEFIVNH